MRLRWLFFLMVTLLVACAPPGVSPFADGTGAVDATIYVPERRLTNRNLFQTKAADVEAVRAVGIEVKGPGFNAMTAPDVDVNSTSVTTRVNNVPAGPNRVVTAKAKKSKGSQLPEDVLQSVSGVVYVNAGQDNPVYVSLRTTPVACVVEALIAADPQKAAQLSNGDLAALQLFIDAVILPDPLDPGKFTNHPYLVDCNAVAQAILDNGWVVPAPPADPTPYLLKPGKVKVIGAPDDAKVWVNDPISPIVDVPAGNGGAPVIVDNVLPTQAGSYWYCTVLTLDGTIGRYQIEVPADTEVIIDMTVTNNQGAVTGIRLDPDSVSFSQVETRQIAVYASDGTKEYYLPPGVRQLSWSSDDPAVAGVGVRQVDAFGQEDPKTSAPGLTWPVGNGDTNIRATLRNGFDGAGGDLAVGMAAVHVNFGFPGAQVTIEHDHLLRISPSSLTLVNLGDIAQLTALEPNIGVGPYQWRSSNPSVVSVEGTGNPVNVWALKAGSATISVTSGTGRTTSITVNTGLLSGTAQISFTADPTVTNQIDFVTLPTANPANSYVTATTNNPFGGNLGSGVSFNLGGYLNTYGAQVFLQAMDPQAGDLFSWSSSNGNVIALSGPLNQTDVVTATAVGLGESIITVRNRLGQTKNFRLVVHFGVGTGRIIAEVPPVPSSLVISAPSNSLTQIGATASLSCSDDGVPVPCQWGSSSWGTLSVEPPVSESFPNANAVVRANNNGTVTITAISTATGKMATRSVGTAFTGNPFQTSITQQAYQRVRIRLLGQTDFESTVIPRTLGQILTFEAEDLDDPGAAFGWDSANAGSVEILNVHSGNRVDVRIISDGGVVLLKATSTTTGNSGVRSVDLIQTNTSGNIEITL